MCRPLPKGPQRAARRPPWGPRPGLGAALAAVVPALLLAASAEAQMPRHRLDAVFPAGGRAGEAVELGVVGAELDSATGLWFSHPGIAAERAEGDASPPRFRVRIAPDVPEGLHDVRVVGPLGVSNPRAFAVGRLAELIEREPNDGPEQAEAIEVNRVVNGRIEGPTDVDWFAFEGKADQRLLIDLAAARLDGRLDGEIRLYDADGRELGYGHGTVGRDPLIDATLPRDGTYRIEIRDVVYAGSPLHVYRLTLHDGPHVDAVEPRAVEPGSTATVALLGRNLGGEPTGTTLPGGRPLERLELTVSVPEDLAIDPDRPGTGHAASPGGGIRGFWFVHPTDRGAAGPVFLAEALAPVVLEEGPSRRGSPMTLTPPCDVSGDFREVDDEDVYRFEAAKGQVWIIEVLAERIGSPVDATLLVQRVMPDGSLRDVVEADDQPDPGTAGRFGTGTVDPAVRFEAPEDGEYLVTVGDLYNARHVDPTAVYRLVIRPERPDFRLVVAPDDAASPEGVTLRAGGRTMAHVLAHRIDGFDGPIRVEAEGLPAGVSADPVVISGNQVQAPIVFTASAGAPPKLGTARLVGRKLDGDGGPIDGSARVAAAGTITRSPPGGNAPTPARVTRGLVLALRPDAPLRLSASPNVVEVAQGGSAVLTASVARREGVAAEVRVTGDALPTNAGVAEAAIGAEADSVAVTLNVPENVEPGTYTVVLRGAAKVSVPDPRNPEATLEANLSEPSNPIILTVRPK